MNEKEVEWCELCGKNRATTGILQKAGSMYGTAFWLCDDCYAERGIEGEDIEEASQ